MSEAISFLWVALSHAEGEKKKNNREGEKKKRRRVSAQSGIILLKVNFRKCKITNLFNTLSVSKEHRVNPVLPLDSC